MTDLKLASCQFSFSYVGNKYRMETVGLSSDSAAESGRVLGECKHLLGRMAENRGTEGGWPFINYSLLFSCTLRFPCE